MRVSIPFGDARFATALLLSTLVAAAALAQQTSTYTILSSSGRTNLAARSQGGQELFALADLATAFSLTVREDVAAGGIIVTTPQNRTIVLTPGQPLASANGRIVSLPSPPVRDGRSWLVPVEFVNRALAPVLDTRVDLRKTSRLIVVGTLRVPEVAVSVERDAGEARVRFDVAPTTPHSVTQDGARLVVRFEADALDLRTAQPDTRDIVAGIRPGDTPQTVIVELGQAAAGFETSTQPLERGERFLIAVSATGAVTAPDTPTQDAPPLPDFTAAGGLRTVVIDPGHGGDDAGVRGVGGVEEKVVTLAIARRVKASLEARLGIRVLLTRDGDRAVGVDARTALANNNKADLFISLHANASPASEASGAQVLTLAQEGYARESGAVTPPTASLPVFGGGSRSLAIIPWDTAQLRWMSDSERLAGLVHAELSARAPMHARSRDRAPLRVLIGANMPAALIETGFLSNAAQAQALAGDALQAEIARAVVEAIIRYRAGDRAEPPAQASPATAPTSAPAGPGGGPA